MNKIIFIGPCGGGCIPRNGASAKNFHLLKFLKQKHYNVCIIDTESWKKRPWILIKLFFVILLNPKAKFIVATDNMSGYRVLFAFSLFPKRRSVVYWVIGGSIGNWIKSGIVKAKPYNEVEWFLVEGQKMQNTLSDCGFANVICVPNFKNISYVPKVPFKEQNCIKFIFFSRIIPAKGCDLILDAVKQMNPNYEGKYSVDFYGPIEDAYKEEFLFKVNALANVSYKGFLDLTDVRNYDVLAQYDIMLFPTFWHGEGFPGVIIDALVAGLPVIASDWSLNADIIKDRVTGRIIKANDLCSLKDVMAEILVDQSPIAIWADNCRRAAMTYDVSNVLTGTLFEKIGIYQSI